MVSGAPETPSDKWRITGKLKFFNIPLALQIANIFSILLWLCGVLLVVYEFFREFHGKKYESTSEVTEKFSAWNSIRNKRIKTGFRLFVVGIILHILFYTIKILIIVYFPLLRK